MTQERDADVSALAEMAGRLVDEFELETVAELDGRSSLLDALDGRGVSTEVLDEGPSDCVFDLVIARPRSEANARSAEQLVARAVASANLVLWLPCKGEPHRWPAWWDSMFDRHGLVALDIVRAWLWGDSQVPVAIKQSACVYARPRDVAKHHRPSMPRDVLHPEVLGDLISEGRRREAYWEQSLRGVNDELTGVVERTTSELQRLTRQVEHAITAVNSDVERMTAGARLGIAARRRGSIANFPSEAERSGPIGSAAQRGSRPTLRRTVAVLSRAGSRMASRSMTSAVASNLMRSMTSDALCDWEWYHGTYMSADPSADPIEHYLEFGSDRRFKPHPLLHSVWYADQHREDVGEADALLHYQLLGRRQMLSPHPLFEPSWYASQVPGNRAARTNSAMHYLVYGWRRGRDPHPLFSTDWYLRHYTDVAAAGLNPLMHYLIHGWREGRHPSPLFHSQWYMEQAGLEEGHVDPLEHYVWFGARNGLAPSPLLDPSWYRRRYGLSGGDALMPVRHYVAEGLPAGLAASPWQAELGATLLTTPTIRPSDARHTHVEMARPGPPVD